MSPFEQRVDALLAVATAWKSPDYPARAKAVANTLGAANRFTEESIAFAINQAMHSANPTALRRWTEERGATVPGRVGLWVGDPTPMAGWRPLLAALLAGHDVTVRTSSASPALLPALANSYEDALGEVGVVEFDQDWVDDNDAPDAVLALGSDEEMAVLAQRCDALGIPPQARWLRGDQLTVAVVGADSSEEELIGVAEDVWLHGGAGPDSVRVLWAPEGQSPDAHLDAFSSFQELFPPHPDRNGALEMPRAFLKASKSSYAWGDGFLVSKGDAAPQGEGHLRWAEYNDLSDVDEWIQAQDGRIRLVAAPAIAQGLAFTGEVVAPGDSHRPRLDDVTGQALYALLTGDVFE